eukprot:scaffold56008_cov65-Phaeocystis_antarctica.AAC.3
MARADKAKSFEFCPRSAACASLLFSIAGRVRARALASCFALNAPPCRSGVPAGGDRTLDSTASR